jgi:molybdopterin molybdotransferase
MQEDAERSGNSVIIRRSVSAGENVQVPGEDFRRGQVLFSAGRRLRPQDLSALATFGVSQISVVRRPRVRVISTGNELVPLEAEVAAGRIRETNALALVAAARKFGFEAESDGIVPDDLAAQRDAMEKALAECDVVLVSGGSSVGERDYTTAVIESFAVHRIHFHGLAIRPGNPTIFASIGGRYVFGLPGQPVSSLIVFYQFVLPFLCHLSGELVDFATFNQSRFFTVSARLSEDVKPLKAKTDYVRLKLSRKGESWEARPVLGKSASLSTLAFADGFAVIPPGESIIPRDTILAVYLFP